MKYLLILLLSFSVFSCNHIKTEDEVATSSEIKNQQTEHRGAIDLIELGQQILYCMQDKITFKQLTNYIPNQEDIKQLYVITKTPIDTTNIRINAELALKKIAAGFGNAKNDGILQEFEWKNVKMENVTSQLMPNEIINSKHVYWNLTVNNKNYRLTAKCMQIGNYWFLGEDLHFNITGL